jgi:pimeloyl-ACP methyl ester carboxylesterase
VGRARVGIGALVVPLALVVAGCAAPPPNPATGTTTASPTTPAADYRTVEFPARDGEVRTGRVFGAGPVAVVLSHMGRTGDGQDDWTGYASELAGLGVRALTYEGRRLGMEDGWTDVLGAVDHLVGSGAERVVLAGASIGAMASLRAAAEAPPQVAGVIWLAGVRAEEGYDFRPPDVAGLGCPTLFIVGDEDAYGAARDTREMQGWATAGSELLVVNSLRHGTDILADGGPPAEQVRSAMTAFVQRVAGAPTAC